MVLVNGGYLHCTEKEILVKNPLAIVKLKFHLSDPEPSWPSCFPTKFSKALFFRVIKSRDCVVKS